MSRAARCLKWGLLVFILVVRLFEICSKDQLHPDEVYSVMLAKCNTAFTVALPPGEYSGEQLQNSLLAHNSLSEDLVSLYTDNSDPPHASLYYMALRICLSGMHVWDPAEVALRGGLLNLFLLAVGYLLMWKLLSRLALGNIMTAALCAMAFLNPASGDCVLLVREYQFAAVSILWYALSLLSVYEKKTDFSASGIIGMLSLIAATALTLSTGYLNAVFLFLLPVGCIVLLLFQRKPVGTFILKMLIAGVVGILLSWCMYAGYFHFITVPTVHTSRAFSDLEASFFAAINRDIIKYAFTVPIFVAMIAVGVYAVCKTIAGRKKEGRPHSHNYGYAYLSVLFCAAVVSILFVQYASVLRESRYSYPFIPLVVCCLPLCFCGLSVSLRRYTAIVLIAYFAIYPFTHPPKMDYRWSAQRELLSEGAVLHGLHPNELPLTYVVTKPDATYTISNAGRRGAIDSIDANVIVLNYRPSVLDTAFSIVRISGPLRVLTRKNKREFQTKR